MTNPPDDPEISVRRKRLFDSNYNKSVKEPYERNANSLRDIVRHIEVTDNPESAAGVRDKRPGAKGAGASMLGIAITPQIKSGAWIDVRGRAVKSLRDLVAIGRLFRNPQFEIFLRPGK
jgi:hypothetical protein